MFLSSHVHVLEWIQILLIPDFQGTSCWKQTQYLKLIDCNGTRTHNQLVRKRTLNHFTKLTNDWAALWLLICTVHLTVCSYHVAYTFQSESTLYSYLNVKELFDWERQDIWNLSECNVIRTRNHLIRKRRRNHLTKLAKTLSCVRSTYLKRTFNCTFLLCHVRMSDWINTL